MGFTFTYVEIDVVQHLFVADLHMQILNMEHKIIVDNMSIAPLNAFLVDNNPMPFRYILLSAWYYIVIGL
jgi:hypothetical protein